MSYAVKEIFLTLQGEGGQAGRPAVFCRFAGCNLWSGREQDRATAVCTFCDTDFVGMDGRAAASSRRRRPGQSRRSRSGPAGSDNRLVVLTGGEPLLQVDTAADRGPARPRLLDRGGDQRHPCPPEGIDWICVSPKADAPGRADRRPGAEAGLPAGEGAARPASRAWISSASCCSRWTVRTAPPTREAAIAYCLAHPRWRLSVQTHKYLGIA
jgi:7-carboxy-7-deazaguanine synthase